MLRKAFKLSTISLLLGSVLTVSAFAGRIDYKDTQISEPSLPVNMVFIGYTYTHPYYNNTWQNSYRAMAGGSPENNYNGIEFGIDHMLNNWLALHLQYSYYFNRSGGDNDGRLSDLTVAGMSYFYVAPNFYLLGMLGAVVDAYVHNGNDTVGTTGNDAFTQTDVNLALGVGMQYQMTDNLYIRPMINLLPFQNRADSNVRLGASIDLVYALS